MNDFRSRDSEFWTFEWEARRCDSEFATQNLGFRLLNPEVKVLNLEVKNLILGVQNLELQLLNLGVTILNIGFLDSWILGFLNSWILGFLDFSIWILMMIFWISDSESEYLTENPGHWLLHFGFLDLASESCPRNSESQNKIFKFRALYSHSTSSESPESSDFGFFGFSKIRNLENFESKSYLGALKLQVPTPRLLNFQNVQIFIVFFSEAARCFIYGNLKLLSPKIQTFKSPESPQNPHLMYALCSMCSPPPASFMCAHFFRCCCLLLYVSLCAPCL